MGSGVLGRRVDLVQTEALDPLEVADWGKGRLGGRITVGVARPAVGIGIGWGPGWYTTARTVASGRH